MTGDQSDQKIISASDIKAGSEDRRSDQRFPGVYSAGAVIKEIRYNVELVDISASGAKITIKHGLMPAVGASVTLCMMNAPSLKAKVVWSCGASLGLEFENPMESVDDIRFVESMGSELYKSLLTLQMEK